MSKSHRTKPSADRSGPRSSLRPILGSDLEKLRASLTLPGQRPLSALVFMDMLGVQRSRYTGLVELGDKPIFRPRMEILVRLLNRRPELSKAFVPFQLHEALDALRQVRPSPLGTRPYLELATLLGSDEIHAATWEAGEPVPPTIQCLLQIFLRGLRKPHIEDRRRFFAQWEKIVADVAGSHGLTMDDVQPAGFRGYRALRQAPKDPLPGAPKPFVAKDLERLRVFLSPPGQRIMPMQTFMNELGIQRSRFTELLATGNGDGLTPFYKPSIEILMRLLFQFPEMSRERNRPMVQDAIELLDMVRPHKRHTLRDLALLFGAEISTSYPWAKGKAMLPTIQRLLAILVDGLRESEPKDQEAFLQFFEEEVRNTVASHGLDWEDLQTYGWAGFRGLNGAHAKEKRSRTGKKAHRS